MDKCSNYHGNMAGPCTCGVFHSQSGDTFSMLFSHNHPFDEADICSSVDCTLSLGTPSTRSSNDGGNKEGQRERRRSNYVSNFCWDIFQQSKHTPSPPPAAHKTSRGSSSNTANSGGDTLLARRCANCDTTSTPLWRNGPRGPKSLCNACGIRFKKEERRATAAAATAATSGGALAGEFDTQHMINSSWGVHHQSQPQKSPFFSPAFGNEFRFMDDCDSDGGIPYLPWGLNVSDRPSLVHDFTR